MSLRGTSADDKRKHLEFAQGVINRMASNSFLFKGWSITIIAAISAFATKDSNPVLMIVPIVSTVLFWSVDAYYLMLERAFRDVYNEIADKPDSDVDYKLTPKKVTTSAWLKVMFTRPILYLFYGLVLLMLILLVLAINNIGVEVKITNGA
jgi:hypothetical protein